MLTRTRFASLQWLFIFSSFFVFSSVSAQEASFDTEQLRACAYPKLPVIVDGSNTNQNAMTDMGKQVRGFIVSVEASLVCLDKASKEASPENAAAINQLYNNGVDQLNFVAKQYNEQVRRYQRYEQVLESSLILQNPYSH